MQAGKTAIATVLGCDTSDVNRYQNERGVYYIGDTYYTAKRKGSSQKLPLNYDWQKIEAEWFTSRYGIEVFKALSTDERETIEAEKARQT